jgi:hypothetical protein
MRLLLIGLALFALMPPGAQSQGDKPIASARLTVVKESTTDLMIRITNLRQSPLQHYGVRFGSQFSIWHRLPEWEDDFPPIAPGQALDHRVAADDPSARVSIVLLGFSDGHYEGERTALLDFFRERGIPDAAARADKAPTVAQGRNASVTARAVPGARLVPILQNLGKAPLEAWGIERFWRGERVSLNWDDMCGVEEGREGHGPIAPGQSRRLSPVGPLAPETAGDHSVELKVVLFRDGRSEGSREVLDQISAFRSKRGQQCGQRP